MIHKLLLGVVVTILLAGPVTAQTQALIVPPLSGKQKESVTNAANKVDGFALPVDQTVSPEEGFVIIKAECNGPIRWIVLAGVKVKYLEIPGGSIAVAVPSKAETISIFAVGLVNGKLTDYAQTNIIVQSNNPSPVTPGAAPYHITMVVDMSAATPQVAALLNYRCQRT